MSAATDTAGGDRSDSSNGGYRRAGTAARTIAALLTAAVWGAGGGSAQSPDERGDGKAPTNEQNDSGSPAGARIPADADRLVFTLRTGTDWYARTEKRTIEIHADHVEVLTEDDTGAGPFRRSIAWWTETRSLLNEGLAASRPDPDDDPNRVCSFEIEVHDGQGKRILQGCCGEACVKAADEWGDVEQPFRRIKPGGPSGPPRPPVR